MSNDLNIMDLKPGQKIFLTDELPSKSANIENWFVVAGINQNEEDSTIILRPLKDDEKVPGWFLTLAERKAQRSLLK